MHEKEFDYNCGIAFGAKPHRLASHPPRPNPVVCFVLHDLVPFSCHTQAIPMSLHPLVSGVHLEHVFGHV